MNESGILSERNSKLVKKSSSNLLKVNKSGVNKSELNSSLNESEYAKNFKELVNNIESNISKRRRLKIVPYSKNDRKGLLKKIEEEIMLLTNLMKNRKEHFASVLDADLFKRASKFHSENVNEKLKAKFLAYLIKEYGKVRDIQAKEPAVIPHKRTKSRGRSTSKHLSSSRNVSPDNYMINIVESNVYNLPKKATSIVRSRIASEDRSNYSSSMPRMQKKVSKKKNNDINVKDEHFSRSSSRNGSETGAYQSSKEIEHQLNMKPEEQAIANRRRKYIAKAKQATKKKLKKQKQHAIDDDSSLNQSTVMTQGWGVTRDRPTLPSNNVDSNYDNSNFSSNKNKRVKQVVDRLYSGAQITQRHHLNGYVQESPTNEAKATRINNDKKDKMKEWIGNKNNGSLGSHASSDEGFWVQNI